MKIELTCVSYNIGGLPDTKSLIERNPESVTNQGIQTVINRMIDKEKLSREESIQLNQFSEKIYNQLAEQTFKLINQEFKPDIYCLQELFRTPEQEVIREILKNNNYEILGDNDVAIVYNRSKFKLINCESTHSKNGSAIYADLEELNTHKIIRVVSDHLAGFNSIIHRSKNKKGSLDGDEALKQNLAAVDIVKKKKNLFDKLFSFDSKVIPSLIIYGLDANTTTGFVDKEVRLHSKRLKPFESEGFICDKADQTPTIKDHNDDIPRRYDYIFSKAIKGQVVIENTYDTRINNPENLGDPIKNLSDHQPVISKISWFSSKKKSYEKSL